MKKIGIIIADADEFAPFEKLISKDVTAAKTFLKKKEIKLVPMGTISPF